VAENAPHPPEIDPLDRRLRYPRLARNFFLADLGLYAVVIALAVNGHLHHDIPAFLMLTWPAVCSVLCLSREVPFAEHLGYLRVAYAVVTTTVTVWPAAETRSALQIIALVVVWHVFYGLAVRSYQKSKARLEAFRAGGDSER